MSAENKSGLILGMIVLAEGWWFVANLAFNGWHFFHYLGFAAGRSGSATGWVAAAVVTAIFTGVAYRLPSVRANLFRPSCLKVLAIGVAIAAGTLEEVVFRKWVMDWLATNGWGNGMQILGSALSFGAVHAIWGLMGKSWRAAAGAMLSTTFLGGMLAIVYVLAARSLAPCIAAHFLINVLIEPGLVLAATRGEMGRKRQPAA